MENAPKISVITPSLNQGQFLEQTIFSVLDQNYPNLEFIIIDGGSTDDSLQIIERYKDRITYWASEKDSGQSEAINKGLKEATGDIVTWLNSDDYYEFGALESVARAFRDSEVPVIFGDAYKVNSKGKILERWKTRNPKLTSLIQHPILNKIKGLIYIPTQPTVFWRREVFNRVGLLREDLHYAMDYEYWLRFLKAGYAFHYLPRVIANYRFHDQSKNQEGWKNSEPEWAAVRKEYLQNISTREKRHMILTLIFFYIPWSVLTFPFRMLSRRLSRFTVRAQ